MTRSSRCALAAVVVLLVALGGGHRVGAQIVLANDNYVSGSLFCSGGPGIDGTVAAKLTGPAPSAYPFRVTKLHVIGCGGQGDLFEVQIYADNLGTLNPGTLLWRSANAYSIPANAAFTVIDLSGENIPVIMSGSIRVGLANVSETFQGFGVDSAITPHLNFVRAGPAFAWTYAESAGVSGDLILRAEITSAAPVPVPVPWVAPLLGVGLALLSAAAVRARARR